VRIHEHTPVTALRRATGRCCAPPTASQARQVLLAGNVYLQRRRAALEARIMPVGTYIACSEPLDAGAGAPA
jgi:gamma-glutamylputrescine oxidase